ncbi:MAG: MFS transporter [Fibrobacterota bacterium]
MDKAVQRESRILKQMYLVLFFAMGAVGPFASVFFKKVLVDTNGEPQMGKIQFIMAAVPLVVFFANIVTGVISDSFRLGRRIVTVLSICAVIPAVMVGVTGEPFFMEKNVDVRFFYAALFFLVHNFFSKPVNTLLDSETLGFLNRNRDRTLFGQYRIWGTFGWAIITVFVGALLTFAPNPDGGVRYSYIFYVGAVSLLLFSILSLFSQSEAKPRAIKIPWEKLFHDRRFFLFLIFVFGAGAINNGIGMQYVGFYLDDVTASPLELGLMFGFWTTLEFPVMHFSKKLIAFFGNRWLMVIGLALTAVKLFLFSLFTAETPFWMKFAAVLIHGPAFGMYFLALIDFVDRSANPKMRATYMGVTTVVRSVIAGSFAGWASGRIIELRGAQTLLEWGTWATLVLGVFFLLVVKGDGPEKKS